MLINFRVPLTCCYVWIKETFPQQWKEAVVVPIYKNGDSTDNSSCRGVSFFINCIAYFIEYCVKVTLYADKVLGVISVYFDVPLQLLILYSTFIKHLRGGNGNTVVQHVSYFVYFNKAKYSGRREIYIIFPLRLNPNETTAVNTLCR